MTFWLGGGGGGGDDLQTAVKTIDLYIIGSFLFGAGMRGHMPLLPHPGSANVIVNGFDDYTDKFNQHSTSHLPMPPEFAKTSMIRIMGHPSS